MFETISSIQNTRVKHLVRLRDGSHRRRQNLFLIEGLREIRRALLCRWPLESLFFCEDLFIEPEAFELLEATEKSGLEMIRMSEEAFRKCAYRHGPDGLLAVGRQQDRSLETFSGNPRAFLVVLEAIEKPGNLGAVFRTANAAGADGLILTNPKTDPYNPNAIRASQGAFFSLPFSCTCNQDLKAFLKQEGVQTICTSPMGKTLLWETSLTGPLAIILGAEDTGLSEDWLDPENACRLPMNGVTDSLNVAATAAVCLFEVVRQRQAIS